MNRPTGITILGILALIGGVLGLCGGIIAVTGSALLGSAVVASGATNAAGSAGLLMVISIAILVLGVLDIVLGIGFLTMKPWAWTLGIVLEAVSIVLALSDFATGSFGFGSIVRIAIAGVILYYLFTPQVKTAFGRAA